MYSFLILSLYALACHCKPITIAPTVTIDSGTLTGKNSPPSVNQYLGIPFGTAARFEKAQPIAPWQGVYDATDYKPTCIQQFDYPEAARNATIKWFNTPPPPGGESEDCLNLNVWAPAGATPGSKPVMFWIYGGGFKFGSGALPMYQGINFAQNQDVVLVTANYRNNVFGWPGSPEIPESEQNLGFYDQRLALDWVHRNINQFGGDNQRVTIFGESAGAGSVDALVLAPPDPLPFSAAIMESGQATIFLSQHDSQDSWKKLTNLTGCNEDSLNCMRQIPATQLKDVIEHNQLKFGPIHDGITWTTNPRNDRLQSKPNKSKIARVPILIGSNRDEATVFTQGQTHEEQVGFTELAFQCPAAVVAEDSEHVGIPSWRYYYNATFANMEIFPGAGVYHSSEIPLIFGTYPKDGATQFQKATSDMMQKAWADFTKDPTQGPGWAQVPQLAVIEGEDDNASDQTNVAPKVENSDSVDKDCGQYRLLYGIVGVLQK